MINDGTFGRSIILDAPPAGGADGLRTLLTANRPIAAEILLDRLDDPEGALRALAEAGTIHALCLSAGDGPAPPGLAAALRAFGSLKSLIVKRIAFEGDAAAEFASWLYVARVPHLALAGLRIDGAHRPAVARALLAADRKAVTVVDCGFGDTEALCMAAAPLAGAVGLLSLLATDVGPEGAAALGAACTSANLRIVRRDEVKDCLTGGRFVGGHVQCVAADAQRDAAGLRSSPRLRVQRAAALAE